MSKVHNRPVTIIFPDESRHQRFGTRIEGTGSEQEAGDVTSEVIRCRYEVSLAPDNVDNECVLVDHFRNNEIFRIEAVLEVEEEIYGQTVTLVCSTEVRVFEEAGARSFSSGFSRAFG